MGRGERGERQGSAAGAGWLATTGSRDLGPHRVRKEDAAFVRCKRGCAYRRGGECIGGESGEGPPRAGGNVVMVGGGERTRTHDIYNHSRCLSTSRRSRFSAHRFTEMNNNEENRKGGAREVKLRREKGVGRAPSAFQRETRTHTHTHACALPAGTLIPRKQQRVMALLGHTRFHTRVV